LTKRRCYRRSQQNTLQLHLASATTCFSWATVGEGSEERERRRRRG
jgi:hypothetical protein